jgi:predicted AlkP superfamily phosphohydrolase/phosphomutase
MSGAASPSQRRVIWLVWDAAAHWVVRRMIDDGMLPALASLERAGLFAATSPPRSNAETPPSLATMFTGVNPDAHLISAFHHADPRGAITAVVPAFTHARPRAPLAWEQAGCEGRTTALLHVPWAIADGETPLGAHVAMHGFGRRHAKGDATALTPAKSSALRFGEEQLALELHEDEVLVRSIEERVEIRLPAKPCGWRDWTLPSGRRTLLSVARRASDGRLLVMHTGSWEVSAGPDQGARRLAQAAGTFVGEGLGRSYRSGVLGPTLREGGDGAAEQLLLHSIHAAASYFQRCCTLTLDAACATDLLIVYQPAIDDVSHELIGLCDSSSATYQPELAQRAWGCLQTVYRWLDRGLATVLGATRAHDHVVVSSDHGMAGVESLAHLNEALAAAGLLVFDATGIVDPARSATAVSLAEGGSLWINRRSLPNGWVEEQDVENLLARAKRALRSCRSPNDGRHVVKTVEPPIRSDGASARVVLSPGFQLAVQAGPGGATLTPSLKSGSHSANTGQPQLRGIFAARGPSVPQGPCDALSLRDVWPLVQSLLATNDQDEAVEARVSR